MEKLSDSQRRAYLLRGRTVPLYLSFAFLPLGLFNVYLFASLKALEPLLISIFGAVVPGIICLLVAQQRFFWSKSRQNAYIRKCIENDNKLKAPTNQDNKPDGVTKNTSQSKNTSSAGSESNKINISPAAQTAAKLATYYAVGKASQKAVETVIGNPFSRSNVKNYDTKDLLPPGQGHKCGDCRYAVPQANNKVLCIRGSGSASRGGKTKSAADKNCSLWKSK